MISQGNKSGKFSYPFFGSLWYPLTGFGTGVAYGSNFHS